MGLNYDNSSSLVYISVRDNIQSQRVVEPLRYVRLENPNRIYFDIKDAILIGEKQQIVFEKSAIKEIRLAQFETVPNKIVRAVITFEEDFDVSKVKLKSIDGNIIVQLLQPALNGDYFNIVYDENGRCEEESEYRYKGNVNIEWFRSIDAVSRGGAEGDLLTVRGWYIEFDAGKPVSQTFYFKDGYASMLEEYGDLRNQKFDGVKVTSYDRYVYGVLEERVEQSWNNNLLTKYVSKDKNGNITYMLTNIWSESGQLLHTYVESENDVFFDSYEYNTDGFLVKYSSRLNAKEEKELTFKYLSYDYKGNWTKRIIYIQDQIFIEERIITYYTNQ